MNRRDFLKGIGLGGLVLTAPKPLAVVAAKMADLEAPPLHIGYCEIGPLADRQRAFELHGVTLRIEGAGWDDLPSRDAVQEFYEKWVLHLLLRRTASKEVVSWLRVPTRFLPGTSPDRDMGAPPGRVRAVSVPYITHKAYRFSATETVECWLAPRPDETPPRHLLPRCRILFNGVMGYTEKGERQGHSKVRSQSFFLYNEFEHVRLERAKAIELGLASADEPTFYSFARPDRRAIRIDPEDTFTTQLRVPFV